MSIKKEKIHTQVLTNEAFTIVSDMGINIVSIVLIAGAGEFVGSLNIGAITSEPIPLSEGAPVTIDSRSATATLDGITIDCTAGGTIHLIARQ